MAIANQIKNGSYIILDNKLYIVLETQHTKPGKGPAYMKFKLKDAESQAIIEKNLRSQEKVEEAFIEEKKLKYLYHEGDLYYFIDQNSFEQRSIDKKLLGEGINFLTEDMEVNFSLYKEKIVKITLPTFVKLKIKKTEPGLKGNTVQSNTKPAELQTGFVLQVPLFINPGDTVKVDTRTGKYIERIS